MTCFRPLQALRIPQLANPVCVISSSDALALRHQGRASELFPLPCGKCVGCRLTYSKNWSIRCAHEASLHEYCSFVTLTYNDYYNDRNGGSLNYRDFTLFMKRLRFALSERYSDYAFLSDPESNLRFFMCGEYGSKTFRPHFHILFFNLDFSDQTLITSRNGYKLYDSDTLKHFWSDPETGASYGHVAVGSLTMESAAYVARYSVKKALQGDQLVYFNSNTGEFLTPEKTNMSRMPGIAKEWFTKYSKDVYTEDFVVLDNGFKCKPPRYYDNLLEQTDPVLFERIKKSRIDFASTPENLANSTIERLIVREKIQLKKLELLPRYL